MNEQQALARVIEELAKLGWKTEDLYDDDEPESLEGMTAEQAAAQCERTGDCHVRFTDAKGNGGTVYLVWGNGPSYLFADHTLRHGFDEAVDEAMLMVWSDYPDEE